MSGECQKCNGINIDCECRERILNCNDCSKVEIGINEKVNHPNHYIGNKLEVIDVIEDFKLGFCLGNVIKYILRAGKKGNRKVDLQKALWYLTMECNKDD